MPARTITWLPGTQPLGDCVVAIGVFDGVHIGHQQLLFETVGDAQARGVQAVAVTFDRDPDQVVAPETAAPQLLPLADKLAAISVTGVDTILVIPFTQHLAELPPESFVESVLLSALTPVAVHVGSDFRFGKMAMGSVDTLRQAGAVHGFEIVPHDLVSVDGSPVTSTRIRGLVSAGQIGEAHDLLGSYPCVTGTVRRGRGEGAQLGFPTANVVPVPFAALPRDGVYAGRAIIADGSGWAAAISVGTPPMFPEAKDYLEAHLVEFEGDLYDQPIELEFWERLRDQQSYASLEDLTAAIAADVAQSLQVAGFTDEELAASAGGGSADETSDDPAEAWFAADGESTETAEQADDSGGQDDTGEYEDEDYIEDPAALAAAERAAMMAPDSFDRIAATDWTAILTRSFSPVSAGTDAYQLTMPLEAEGIPFVWDPYPPDAAPTADARLGTTRPYTLQVPPREVARVRELLGLEPQPPRAVADGLDGWTEVRCDMHFNKQRFLAIDGALFSAGIDHVWAPYPPQDAPLLRLGIWDTERFSVSVPDEMADAADELATRAEQTLDEW